jgi:hypothetical protein
MCYNLRLMQLFPVHLLRLKRRKLKFAKIDSWSQFHQTFWPSKKMPVDGIRQKIWPLDFTNKVIG